MAAEDPLSWDRQVRSLAEFEELYGLRLKHDPLGADPNGPFIGAVPLTERHAFAEVRALPADLPLIQPLLRWMYRLADARVNAGLRLGLARFWSSDRLDIDPFKDATRASLLLRVLADTSTRAHYWGGLERALADAPTLVSELWQRREELAKRAGFESARAVIDPIDDFAALSEQWQALTVPLATEVLPRQALPLFGMAMAESAREGWPARLTAPAMATLLGDRTWLRLAPVKEPLWPILAGPASFARALGALGQSLARAWAPPSYPFVIANDAWKLDGHVMAALLASLTLNESWHGRVLGLSRDQARGHVRAFARSLLFASRLLCLKVALRAAAVHSPQGLSQNFMEHTASIFGFELPKAMAGLLPRLGRSDAQRLLGLWMGLTTHVRFIHGFDEDWYRDPRAIETLRGQVLEKPSEALTREHVTAALPIACRWLQACLEG